jgi:hypothetical protein
MSERGSKAQLQGAEQLGIFFQRASALVMVKNDSNVIKRVISQEANEDCDDGAAAPVAPAAADTP